MHTWRSGLNVYELQLERSAEKDLDRIPDDRLGPLVAGIRALAETPRPPGAVKLVGSDSDWRVRVGRYRIIYEVDDDARIVRVYRVRHRSHAYD
jgi:mRNA interferase RelE/StbE